MKHQNYFNYLSLLRLIALFAFLSVISPAAKAQSKVDLKTLKLTEAAYTITDSAYELAKFFDDEKIIKNFEDVAIKGKDSAREDYAKNRGIELKEQLKKAYISLLDLIVTLNKAKLWDEQLDKDVAKLITGGDLKTQLEKYGGARKLLESGLTPTAALGLKKDIEDVANLIIWQTKKTKETCRYITIGAVVSALQSKKAVTFSIKGGCKS